MKTVDFDTACSLEELGFDGEYNFYVDSESKKYSVWSNKILRKNLIPAPRLDDVAYWLRDEFKISIEITSNQNGRTYNSEIVGLHKIECLAVFKSCGSYDDALEAAVKKAIEIIKTKDK